MTGESVRHACKKTGEAGCETPLSFLRDVPYPPATLDFG